MQRSGVSGMHGAALETRILSRRCEFELAAQLARKRVSVRLRNSACAAIAQSSRFDRPIFPTRLQH